MFAILLASLLASPAGERPPAAPPVSEKPPSAPPVESPPKGRPVGDGVTYAGVYARVLAGERLVLAVGVDPPQGAVFLKTASEVDPGVYDCFLSNDTPVFRKRDAAPGVAAPATFRGGYHASHDCPSCGHHAAPGTGNWIIRRFNGDGTHEHVCEKCGASWNHR